MNTLVGSRPIMERSTSSRDKMEVSFFNQKSVPYEQDDNGTISFAHAVLVMGPFFSS